MGSKMMQIRISRRLLKSIDEAAVANMTSRSSYVRQAVIMQLNADRLVPNPRPSV